MSFSVSIKSRVHVKLHHNGNYSPLRRPLTRLTNYILQKISRFICFKIAKPFAVKVFYARTYVTITRQWKSTDIPQNFSFFKLTSLKINKFSYFYIAKPFAVKFRFQSWHHQVTLASDKRQKGKINTR